MPPDAITARTGGHSGGAEHRGGVGSGHSHQGAGGGFPGGRPPDRPGPIGGRPAGPVNDWRHYLLRAIGAPVSVGNLVGLELWAASEQVPADWHNPLGATIGWPGSRILEAGAVEAYPSQAAGIGATALALHQRGMAAVLEALRGDLGITAIYRRVNASGWCPGCQDGHYPIALYWHLHPPVGNTTGTGAGTFAGTAPIAQTTLGGPGGGGVPKPPPPSRRAGPSIAWRYFAEVFGLTVPAVASKLNAISRRPHR